MPLLLVLAALQAATSEGATITWNNVFELSNSNGVAEDSFAQLITGDVVEAKYVNSFFSPPQPSIVVGDTLNGRSITFDFQSFDLGGGGFDYYSVNTGDTALDQVLQGYGYQGSGGQGPIYWTISGLTLGLTYSIQLWSHSEQGWFEETSGTYHGTGTPIAGSPSWFTTGSFVADNTDQLITLVNPTYPSGEYRPEIDAWMVTVPEPSTYALLLLSGAVSVWFVKRRRH